MTLLQAHMEIASQMTRDISEEAEAAQDGKSPPKKLTNPKLCNAGYVFLCVVETLPTERRFQMFPIFCCERLDLTRIDGSSSFTQFLVNRLSE